MTLSTDITSEERDALYEQVLNHLGGLDELGYAILTQDFERAERLGIEFGDELRLMEDLGWDCPPLRRAVELTMPHEQMHRVFTRLRADIEGLREDEERDEAETESETRHFRDRAKRVSEACERVLSVVGRMPPPPAGSEEG